MSDAFDDDDYIEIAALLRRVHLRKRSVVESRLSRWDTTLPQWGMLWAVAHNPDASTHALAVLTAQSDQAAGALVARLARRGLLDRRSGAGRAIRHQITAEGRRVLETGNSAVAEVTRSALEGFTEAETKELARLLAKMDN